MKANGDTIPGGETGGYDGNAQEVRTAKVSGSMSSESAVYKQLI
jgi:hypothetical protein